MLNKRLFIQPSNGNHPSPLSLSPALNVLPLVENIIKRLKKTEVIEGHFPAYDSIVNQ